MPEDEEVSGFGFNVDEGDDTDSEGGFKWAPMDHPPFGTSADGEMSFLMHGGLQSDDAGPIPTCMYSQKVILYLAEAGIPFTDVLINFKDKPQWLLDKHPAGTTPVLYYKGEWVMGSDDIIEELPRLFPNYPLIKSKAVGDVIPANARGELTSWMEKWVQIDPGLQDPPTEEWCMAGRAFLTAMQPIEAWFKEGNKYLCGTQFGQEDATWYAHINSAFDYLVPLNGFQPKKDVPNIAAWCKRVLQRPAVKEVSPPETKLLRVPHFVSKICMRCPYLVYRLSGGFPMPKLPAKWKKVSKWKAAAKLAVASVQKEGTAADKMGAGIAKAVQKMSKMSSVNKGQRALMNKSNLKEGMSGTNRDDNGFPIDLEPNDAEAKGANSASQSFLEKSRKIPLSRNGNLYYRLLGMSWPWLMFTFVMSYVVAIGILMFLMLAIHEDVEADNYSKFMKVLWLSAANLISCGYHGYIMAAHPAVSAVCSFQQFVGLLLNCIMTAMIFTKFQQPVSDMIFSNSLLVTKRDGKTALMIRIGNYRCNRIYTPDIRLSMMMPRRTLEGDTLIETTSLEVNTPSFITSTFSLVHIIDDDSAIGGGRLTPKSVMPGGEFSGIAFTIVFVGMDGTTASDITAFTRYSAEDVLFGDFGGGTGLGFQSVMVPQQGNMKCDFTKFNHLMKTDTTAKPGNPAGKTNAQQDWNNLFSELCM